MKFVKSIIKEVIKSLRDSVEIAYNKVKRFFAPVKELVKDACKLIANITGAFARDVYILGAKTANVVRDFANKPAQSINYNTANKIETNTVRVLETVLNTVIDVIFTGLELVFTWALLNVYDFYYVTNYKTYNESKSIQYFLFDSSNDENEVEDVQYEEVIEQITYEVEIITDEIKLLTAASNELIEASDALITKESSTQQVVYHDIDEETYDNGEIEIINIDEFTTAVENKFMSSALSYVSANDKTIQYKAIQGKRCRKGYRRVGNACVLISYLQLKSLYTV